MKLLIFDMETGGLYHSLNAVLSLGAIVWEDGKLLDRTEILIKGDPGYINPEALKINKIVLEEHLEKALPIQEAVHTLIQFLNKNFEELPVIVGGHNTHFDVDFLQRLFYLAGDDWTYNNYFSHRFLDTMSILYYLYMKKKIPYLKSLHPALEYFNIAPEPSHEALKDAIDTAKLLNCLLAYE